MGKCNCISEDQERIKEYILKSNENIETVDKADFENVAFMIDGGMQLYSEIKVEYQEKNKKGELKCKKKKFNMSYNFCPMCGQSYK